VHAREQRGGRRRIDRNIDSRIADQLGYARQQIIGLGPLRQKSTDHAAAARTSGSASSNNAVSASICPA